MFLHPWYHFLQNSAQVRTKHSQIFPYIGNIGDQMAEGENEEEGTLQAGRPVWRLCVSMVSAKVDSGNKQR